MATVGRMVVAFGRMVVTSKRIVATLTRDVPKPPHPEPCHSLEGALGTLGRLHLCRHESNTKQTKRQKQQKHTYQQRAQVKQQGQHD